MSGRLGNAPVYFALGQVGFSPVMSMASFIPEIQEQLRTTGFPEFHVGQFTQVRLSSDGKEAEALDSHPLWIFMNESRSLCFVLSVDSLTLQTTASQRHDVFISEAIRGLAVVRSVVGVGSVKRIGLRYLGAIQPEPSEDVNDYLAEGLHGVAVTGRLVAGATELVFDRDLSRWGTHSRVVVKIHRAIGPIGFPLELEPAGLALQSRFSAWGPADHAVIDADHFIQQAVSVDVAQLQTVFEYLHESVAEAFRACASDHAHRIWAGEAANS